MVQTLFCLVKSTSWLHLATNLRFGFATFLRLLGGCYQPSPLDTQIQMKCNEAVRQSVCVCVCIYTHIHTHIIHKQKIQLCIYIYSYAYTHTWRCRALQGRISTRECTHRQRRCMPMLKQASRMVEKSSKNAKRIHVFFTCYNSEKEHDNVFCPAKP